MAPLGALLSVLSVATAACAQEAYVFEPLPITSRDNGFAYLGAGNWPPSNVGVPLVPQQTAPEVLSLLKELDPARIESTIQTLVNFGTRNTASTTTSPTRGIGAAREWLLKEMTALAVPSKGLIKVSMPCYDQPADPDNDLFIAAKVCNVQAEITGAGDPNRTYVYTGHYDSRRLNNSDFTNDAPGADDNTSAVAIALEMLRILAPVVTETPPAASIIIAAVAGEEQGLYGSNFLAQTRMLLLQYITPSNRIQ
jgi:acetylornithine deacetylase/succinyl-diaminopimelate desuccinylase-like protein